MKSNISKHPCANKCTDFKEEQCKTCLVPDAKQWYDVPNHHILEQSEKSDFLIGDVVVLNQYAGDFAKSNNALYELIAFENKLETLAILSAKSGLEVRSGIEYLRPATVAELQANRRLTEAEQALAEVS
ncbi:hypothetical protein [Acinetobacter wuhouensis]|uniref:Uncharacterized protein n=1 Tax=Acinetobacter wuhouensis TaxID=1879050 RepID=A0A4Q7AM61_9GAMM|nr:hypothetical protein [Acinetobacter wuhouensis]RZG48091.1 hypothetical protein EXU28_04815 [Acinetobacter wuhouensis]